jgi:regulatory protein
MRRRFGPKGDASQVSPLNSRVNRSSDDSLKDDALPDLDDQGRRIKARSNARNSAIRLLARREHASAEIKQKLKFRGFDDQLATEIVDDLTRQRLLSDERFAEAFIRAHAGRGQGPVRLRAELRQLKLSAELVESRIRGAGVDWAASARECRQRKFGLKIPKVAAERAKQMRFLQYRGFTAEQIRTAMGASFEEDHLLDAEAEPVEPDSD